MCVTVCLLQAQPQALHPFHAVYSTSCFVCCVRPCLRWQRVDLCANLNSNLNSTRQLARLRRRSSCFTVLPTPQSLSRRVVCVSRFGCLFICLMPVCLPIATHLCAACADHPNNQREFISCVRCACGSRVVRVARVLLCVCVRVWLQSHTKQRVAALHQVCMCVWAQGGGVSSEAVRGMDGCLSENQPQITPAVPTSRCWW